MSNYCTSSEIRDLADDQELSAAVLGLIIPAVSRAIDRHCRRRFYATTVAKLHDYDIDRPGTIRLIDELLSLTSVTTSAGDSFTATDFSVEPVTAPYARLILKPNRVLSYEDTPKQAITVTGSWGYSSTVPEEVAIVAKLWTLMLYRKMDLIGVDTARIAGVSLQIPTLTDKLPEELAGWLKPLVKHRIGAV